MSRLLDMTEKNVYLKLLRAIHWSYQSLDGLGSDLSRHGLWTSGDLVASGTTVLMADGLSLVHGEVRPPWILHVYAYTMNACEIWNLDNSVEGLHALTHRSLIWALDWQAHSRLPSMDSTWLCIYHKCLTGYWSGEFGGQVHALSSMSNSLHHSSPLLVWYAEFSCWVVRCHLLAEFNVSDPPDQGQYKWHLVDTLQKLSSTDDKVGFLYSPDGNWEHSLP